MVTPLSVEIVEDDDGPARIVAKGELDLSSAGQLEAALDRVPDQGDVILDLGGLSFIDSSGIRVLVLAHGRWQDSGHRLVLRDVSPVCQRTFEVAGLGGLLLFESEDAPDAHS
jgi:anti-anti-sigma factor